MDTVPIPLEVAAAISRYLGGRPYDEVCEALPVLRALCQSVIDGKPAEKPTVTDNPPPQATANDNQ